MSITSHLIHIAISAPDSFRNGNGFTILNQLTGPRVCEVVWALLCSGRPAEIYYPVLYGILSNYNVSVDIAKSLSEAITNLFRSQPTQSQPLHGPPILLVGLCSRTLTAYSHAHAGRWMECLRTLGVENPTCIGAIYDHRFLRRFTLSEPIAYAIMLEYARSHIPPLAAPGPRRDRKRRWDITASA